MCIVECPTIHALKRASHRFPVSAHAGEGVDVSVSPVADDERPWAERWIAQRGSRTYPCAHVGPCRIDRIEPMRSSPGVGQKDLNLVSCDHRSAGLHTLNGDSAVQCHGWWSFGRKESCANHARPVFYANGGDSTKRQF